MRDLAEQLLKSAVRSERVKNTKARSISWCSNLRQRWPPVSPICAVYHHCCSLIASRKEKLYLTGRPYTLAELDLLIESVHILGGLPGSQLQSYRQALHQGRMNATLYFLYQYVRAQERQRGALSEISKKWSMQAKANVVP